MSQWKVIAARTGPDRDEYTGKRLDDGQARGQQLGGQNGIEERKAHAKTPPALDNPRAILAPAAKWSYLGLAFSLSGSNVWPSKRLLNLEHSSTKSKMLRHSHLQSFKEFLKTSATPLYLKSCHLA
jgi:hypothetical protein